MGCYARMSCKKMTRIPVLILLVTSAFLSLSACNYNHSPIWQNRFYGGFQHSEKEWCALQKDIAKADHNYDHSGELRSSGDKPSPHAGINVFQANPQSKIIKDSKGFVVVQLSKAEQVESIRLKVSKLNDFFFTRGADRVLITGYRGSGTRVYSDKSKYDHVNLVK